MLPTTHTILGLLFSIFLYPYFGYYSIIIFLSSFLVDADHYLWCGFKNKNWSLKDAYYFYIGNDKLKNILHIFHVVEFLILLIILALLFRIFLFVLIGVSFHYVLDIIDLIANKKYGRRAISLIGWLKRNL